jgi:hypothetical protein
LGCNSTIEQFAGAYLHSATAAKHASPHGLSAHTPAASTAPARRSRLLLLHLLEHTHHLLLPVVFLWRRRRCTAAAGGLAPAKAELGVDGMGDDGERDGEREKDVRS